jgi:hypothetical protein
VTRFEDGGMIGWNDEYREAFHEAARISPPRFFSRQGNRWTPPRAMTEEAARIPLSAPLETWNPEIPLCGGRGSPVKEGHAFRQAGWRRAWME